MKNRTQVYQIRNGELVDIHYCNGVLDIDNTIKKIEAAGDVAQVKK